MTVIIYKSTTWNIYQNNNKTTLISVLSKPNDNVLIWWKIRQAGAELGQAQLKLGLDFTLILVDLVSQDLVQIYLLEWFSFVSLIEQIWFYMIGSLHSKYFVWSIWFCIFSFVALVKLIWFNRLVWYIWFTFKRVNLIQ